MLPRCQRCRQPASLGLPLLSGYQPPHACSLTARAGIRDGDGEDQVRARDCGAFWRGYTAVMEPSAKRADAAERVTIPAEWLAEFEAAARRPLETRMRYAFIKTYKPVMDDAPFRAFATTAEYRRWCEENLPEWLGYGR